MEEILKIPNGAKFVRADLHIHSFGGSEDVKDESMTPEAIVDKAIDSGLKLIAVTDHNSHLNIDNFMKLYEQTKDKLLILPGVEISSTDGHVLAYFSPDQKNKVHKLLSDFDIVENFGKKDTRTTFSMVQVLEKINTLGGIGVAAHIDSGGFEEKIQGFPVNKKDILLCSSLYGLEINDPDNLEIYELNEKIDQYSAERRKIIRERLKNLKTDGLPKLINSDAHLLDNVGLNSKGQPQTTRFKMNELSFESFKIAFLDPKARIKPEVNLNLSYPQIIGLTVEGGFIDGLKNHFNPNLNCIIGARGSGKSTLLNSIMLSSSAYGSMEDIDEDENMPDKILLYYKDAFENIYKVGKARSERPEIHNKGVKQDISIIEIEGYKQNELMELSGIKESDKKSLLEFIDDYNDFGDLLIREEKAIVEIDENILNIKSCNIIEKEIKQKEKESSLLAQKIKIAKESKVKEFIDFKQKIEAEKSLKDEITDYIKNLKSTLSNFDDENLQDIRDMMEYLDIEEEDIWSKELLLNKQTDSIKDRLANINQIVRQNRNRIDKDVKNEVDNLKPSYKEWDGHLKRYESKIAEKEKELKEKGVKADLNYLGQCISQQNSVISELNKLKKRHDELVILTNKHGDLINQLKGVREKISNKRELITPLVGTSNHGKISDAGSVDNKKTQARVIDILEGGRDAFEKRYEMYFQKRS